MKENSRVFSATKRKSDRIPEFFLRLLENFLAIHLLLFQVHFYKFFVHNNPPWTRCLPEQEKLPTDSFPGIQCFYYYNRTGKVARFAMCSFSIKGDTKVR